MSFPLASRATQEAQAEVRTGMKALGLYYGPPLYPFP